MEAERVSPGRSQHLSPARDTLQLCGELVEPILIKIRDIRFDKNFVGDTYGKFRLGCMEFREFIYLSRKGVTGPCPGRGRSSRKDGCGKGFRTDETGLGAAFGYAAAVGGSIGMVFGFHIGMQYLVMPALLGSD